MRIAIIGAGAVGATTAYSILLKKLPAEIMLVDTNKKHCSGEILDLEDVVAYCQSPAVVCGDFASARSADIIIIAAGARQEPGQSRTDLATTNKAVITAICKELMPIASNSIVIMVSNPVDILVTLAQQITGLPHGKIFASGTSLDTQRLIAILSKKYSVAEQSITAYILGEHGDTQFPAWSTAQIAGIPLCEFGTCNVQELAAIAQSVSNRAGDIIACKGATYFGIAACVTQIVEAIMYDQKLVIPLSCYQKEFDLYLSMPCILGKNGIEQVLSTTLTQDEHKKLIICVESIKALL